MSVAIHRPNSQVKFIDFSVIGDDYWKQFAKRYIFARLNYRVPPRTRRTSAATARTDYVILTTTLGVIRERQWGTITTITRERFQLLWADLCDRITSPKRRAAYVQTLQNCYYYRRHLPDGGLAFLPWGGRSADKVVGHIRARENTTPRIPEEVMGPTLRWALHLVEDLADDIIAEFPAAGRPTRKVQPREPRSPIERTHRWIHRRRERGWGLPKIPSGTPRYGARLAASREDPLALLNETRVRAEAAISARSLKHDDVRRLLSRAQRELGWDDGAKRLPPPEYKKTAAGDPLTKLRAWAAQARTDGRRLPGTTAARGRVSHYTGDAANVHLERLANEAGFDRNSFQRRPDLREELRKLVDELGVAVERPGFVDARADVITLVAACYIIIAFLTGMRDSEVQELRRGCLREGRSADGTLPRYWVRSRVFKGRVPTGDEEEWIAIEPVAQAVRVLERIATAADAPEDGYLFYGFGLRGRKPMVRTVLRYIQRFTTDVNSRVTGASGLTAIPGVDGKAWHFTTRQFRRTLAWYIANQPFGVVAGRIQFKQASIEIFEGYAGTSRSGFRDEVAAERQLGKETDLLATYEGWRAGDVVAGPKASDMVALFEHVERTLTDRFPGKVIDESQVRLLLRATARVLYPGLYNWCIFDPGRARCLKNVAKSERRAPLFVLCDPVGCANSCFTKRHVPAIQAAIDDGKRWSGRNLSDVQTKALQTATERWHSILEQLENGQERHDACVD